jgi:hypothetical protein
MKIIVQYNSQGEIRTVTVKPRTQNKLTVNTQLMPRPGFFVAEVEAEHVHDDQNLEALRSTKEAYRIGGHPKQPRLVRK